jgi:hypothetical protein
MDLVGNDELQNEEMMRKMWKESMKSVNCTQARITYDNFLLLMKGQTKEPVTPEQKDRSGSSRTGVSLRALPEGVEVSNGEVDNVCELLAGDVGDMALTPDVSPILSGRIVKETRFLGRESDEEISMHSLPNLGVKDMNDSSDSSIRMSPGTGADGHSPNVCKIITDVPVSSDTNAPGLDLDSENRPTLDSRMRSFSLGNEVDENAPGDDVMQKSGNDWRRAINLPEHDRNLDDELAKNKSAIAVNRQLYRAHRQMRIAVMDASRRFEEQQARRARDTLIAQKDAEYGAGLVMRHGYKVQVTSEAIRGLLETNKEEQQVLVEKANRRGGRGRHARKKTISDMSAMMAGSMTQDELGDISKLAGHSQTPNPQRSIFSESLSSGLGLDMPSFIEGVQSAAPPLPLLMGDSNVPVPVVDMAEEIRLATVPGEFRKTLDPFSSDGMYGGSRMSAKLVTDIQAESLKRKLVKKS